MVNVEMSSAHSHGHIQLSVLSGGKANPGVWKYIYICLVNKHARLYTRGTPADTPQTTMCRQ